MVIAGEPRMGKSLLLAVIGEVVATYNVPAALKLDVAQTVGYAQGKPKPWPSQQNKPTPTHLLFTCF